jgi:hypothetical protein
MGKKSRNKNLKNPGTKNAKIEEFFFQKIWNINCKNLGTKIIKSWNKSHKI